MEQLPRLTRRAAFRVLERPREHESSGTGSIDPFWSAIQPNRMAPFHLTLAPCWLVTPGAQGPNWDLLTSDVCLLEESPVASFFDAVPFGNIAGRHFRGEL